MAAIKALQQWCKIQCEGYRDVAITNMTTSFRDGLAFCALIHKHRPDLINYDSLLKENVYENNNLAFRTAEDKLGIPALLEAEDMVALRVPDRLSVLTYVSQYYNYFHGRSPIGGMAGVKRPAEDNKEEPSGKKCQPVIAKPFPSKSSKENRPAPTIAVSSPSRPSPKTARSAVQVTTENSRTLSSSCAVCKKHVHLVQRHLVDGNLYHRNCFKCYECSKILLSGTFTNGPKPGTFICTFHSKPQYESKTPSTKGPITATEGPSWMLTRKENAPISYPSSVNTKPNSTMSTTKALSPLTEKTQSARQKFFQSPTSKLDSLPSHSLPAASSEISSKSRVVPNVDGEKAKVKLLITPKLTEGNSNNNNTVYPSNFKLTDKRSGNALADIPTWKKDQHNPGKVLLKVAKPSSNLNSSPANVKPLSSPVTNKDSHRPQSTPYNKGTDASHSESPADWRSMLKPVKGQKTAAGKCSSVSTETKTMESLSKLSPSSPANIPSPLRAPVPIITPPVSLDDQSTSPLEPSHNGSRSWELKNGKGSSPTNASKPEHELPKRKPDYIPKDEILKELQEIEDNLNDLEKKGVEMEKRLRRSEDDEEEDVLMDELMVDWFNLIRNKQVYMRRESELVYIAKTQDLEEQQPGVEEELRRLLEKPEHFKTARDRTREAELMEKLVEIVNDRNAILEGLDEDRLREDEEDEQLNQMMHNLDLKKGKNKKKSPISKLFWWKNKDAVED